MRKIVHLSDLHFGRHDERIVAALLDELKSQKPDLVVVSGDFTQRARSAQFELSRAFLDRIEAPKLLVPGNHDVPLYNVVRRFLTPLGRYRRYVAPAGTADAFFCDEEIAVLGLNTARSLTFKNGRISHEQMAHLRRVFASVGAGVAKVLVTHHPVESPSGSRVLELAGRSRPAMEAIASAGIHILLSGHHHQSQFGNAVTAVEADGSILVVHAGTATSTRLRGGESNTFNILEIEGKSLSVSLMRWGTDGAFVRDRSASYVLAPHGWRAAPAAIA